MVIRDGKHVWVTTGSRVSQRSITHHSPDPSDIDDCELQRLMNGMSQFSDGVAPGVLMKEVLTRGDPRAKTASASDAKSEELEGFKRLGVFESVKNGSLPRGANVLGTSFFLAIKTNDDGSAK